MPQLLEDATACNVNLFDADSGLLRDFVRGQFLQPGPVEQSPSLCRESLLALGRNQNLLLKVVPKFHLAFHIEVGLVERSSWMPQKQPQHFIIHNNPARSQSLEQPLNRVIFEIADRSGDSQEYFLGDVSRILRLQSAGGDKSCRPAGYRPAEHF